jgi:hypothetical protein
VDVNGWWGWNIEPDGCSAGNMNQVMTFTNGRVEFALRPVNSPFLLDVSSFYLIYFFVVSGGTSVINPDPM